MIDAEKKSEYGNHYTDERHRSFRPKKITDIRLKQIKEIVFDDDKKTITGKGEKGEAQSMPTMQNNFRRFNLI